MNKWMEYRIEFYSKETGSIISDPDLFVMDDIVHVVVRHDMEGDCFASFDYAVEERPNIGWRPRGKHVPIT